MPPELDIKWDQVRDSLALQLKDEAHALLESTDGDLGGWAAQIAADIVEAASLGRDDLLEHLKSQMRTLAGSKRVEIREAGWRTLDAAVGAAVNVMSTMVRAAVVA